MIDANVADLELYAFARDELLPSAEREYGRSLADAVVSYRRGSDRAWNRRNLAACRLKQYLVYKPALRLYRWKRGLERSAGPTRPGDKGIGGAGE
jgi:hypothetical protein